MKFYAQLLVFSLIFGLLACGKKESKRKSNTDSSGSASTSDAMSGLWMKEVTTNSDDENCYSSFLFNIKKRRYASFLFCQFEKDNNDFKKGDAITHIYSIGSINAISTNKLTLKVEESCKISYRGEQFDLSYRLSKTNDKNTLTLSSKFEQNTLIKASELGDLSEDTSKDNNAVGCLFIEGSKSSFVADDKYISILNELI